MGRYPDRNGRPDHGSERLVRRAAGARRGAGRRRHQRRRRRPRPAGAAHHGRRLLRSRAGGRRRKAGQRRCDLRRRTHLLRGLDPGIGIYAAAGSCRFAGSSNPMLTELGRANVFRVIYRDDAAGIVAGNYLADHWADKKIAILHDDTTFGKGVADLTKEQLNRVALGKRSIKLTSPGNNYAAEITQLQGSGDRRGVHWRIRHRGRAHGARSSDRGYPVQLVTGIGLTAEDFGLIAGPAAEGTLFIDHPDPRRRAEAAPVVERFRASASNRRVTPCTLMRPFRRGRRRPRSRLAGAPGDDRIPAGTPVRHRAGPDRLRRQGRPHRAKPGMVRLAGRHLRAAGARHGRE